MKCRLCGMEKPSEGFKSMICAGCLRDTPNTFGTRDPMKARAVFVHTCDHGHISLSVGSNDKHCPLCHTIDASCKECGRVLNYKVMPWDRADHFCSTACQLRHTVKKNHAAGPCSVCGKEVSKRDQNARGIDCGCSAAWYGRHNGSEEMRESSRRIVTRWNMSEEGRRNTTELNRSKVRKMGKPGHCKVCGKACAPGERNVAGVCKKCMYQFAPKGERNWSATEAGKKFHRILYAKRSAKYADKGPCTGCGAPCAAGTRHSMTGLCRECVSKYRSVAFRSRISEMYERIMSTMPVLPTDGMLDDTIDLCDLETYESVPGVWALWGVDVQSGDEHCLTVGQTVNIAKEIRWTPRVLANDRLGELEIEDPGCTGRWHEIQVGYRDLRYVLVCRDMSDKVQREIIEANYAVHNRLLFWKPSLNQLTSFSGVSDTNEKP